MSRSRTRRVALVVLAGCAIAGLISPVPLPDFAAAPAAAVGEGAPEGEAAFPATELPSTEDAEPAPDVDTSESNENGVPAAEATTEAPSLSCEVGNIFSMSNIGQMQRVEVDEGRTRAIVTNIGARLPGDGMTTYNGLGIGLDGTIAYAYDRSAQPKRIYAYDVGAGTWSPTQATLITSTNLVAGAVSPDGTYWLGGFNGSTGLDIWAMTPDSKKVERRGRIDLRRWQSSSGNGDFAFDSQGNLYVVRGTQGRPDLDIFRVDAASLLASTGSEWVPVSAKLPTARSPFASVVGAGYDARGSLFLGGENGLAYVDLPASTAPPTRLELTGASWMDTTDLASCSFPPTVKLQMNLPDGRVYGTDQFGFEMRSNATSIGSRETAGSDVGVQPEAVGPIPVTSGAEITLAQTPLGATALENYSSNWECTAEGSTFANGAGIMGSFTVPIMSRGGEVLCTIRNTIPEASKSATPASGTPVDEGSVVRYDLAVDNSNGQGPAAVDYWDSLRDVLDDAIFVDADGNPTPAGEPHVTTSGGVSFDTAQDWDADEQWLRMRGSIAAGATGTLSFAVKVRQNSEMADVREDASDPQGYFLRNRLVRGNSDGTAPDVPETCEPGMCTEHPVKAWTVTKDSVPANGTRVYKGGNVHYKVTATNLNAGTPLSDLVLQDDVTQVMKTAGWAPDAPAIAGSQARGVYLFNADGRSIGFDGAPNTSGSDVFQPVQDVDPPQEREVVVNGGETGTRWIVTSGEPLTLPAEAVRAEMWFAVQAAESPAGIPDPTLWLTPENTPSTGWAFVNYATGSAKSGSVSLPPNACVTGADVPDTDLQPDSGSPVDEAFPEQCRTMQVLSQNTFTIRKDAGGEGVSKLVGDPAWGGDPTGLTNLTGHNFEVRDSVNGTPSDYPSAKLCRTTYDPFDEVAPWRGQWVDPAQANDQSTWDFASEQSGTLQKILDWNNSHPDAPLPLCGTLAEVTDGEQAGAFKSDGLGEGDYWLVETRAPDSQVNPETSATRPVQGVQLLAEPIPFTVWPESDAPASGESMHGRGQLDVGLERSGFVDRCDTGGAVGERPTACVNSAGRFLVVKDAAPTLLPLAGGQWLAMLIGSGALILAASLVWALARRRKLLAVGDAL